MRANVRRLARRVPASELWRFASALAPTTGALAIQLVTFAITARGLGVSAFGEYAALLGIAGIAVELIGLGGADLLVRAVARDPSSFPRFFGNMLLLVLWTLPPVMLFGVWVARGPMASLLPVVPILVALFGETIANRLSASGELAMIAHSHTTRASCVRVAAAGSRFVVALIYFTWAGQHALTGWIWAVFVQSMIFGVGVLAALVWMYGRPVFELQRGELRSGVAFAINQVSRATQGNIDRVILARFTDYAVLGAYAAGSRTLTIGLFPIQVMTRLLYPNFFRHGEQGIAATRRYALRCLPAMLGTGVMSCLAVLVLAQAMPAILGHDFLATRQVAMLLSLALPLIGLQYLAADTLTGAGFQHIRAVIYAVSALTFALVMVAGTRLAGVHGLIVGFLAAHALLAAVLWTVALTKATACATTPAEA